MAKIQVTLEGISPLLVNMFHEKYDDRGLDPEVAASGRLYPKNAKGENQYPTENFRKSFIGAAGRYRIKGKVASTDVAAGLYISPAAAATLHGNWVPDSRPVVMTQSPGKPRIIRHRPMFEQGWHVTIQIETTLITDLDLLRKIVEDAGNYVGVGDFRPGKKGQFGRYRVSSWEVLQK